MENHREYNLAFHCALRKYGKENVEWQILEENIVDNLLNEKEMLYIKQYDSYKNGYNETIGGNFCPMHDPEIAAKVSKKLKGRVLSKEWKEKLSKSAKTKGKLIRCIEQNRDFFKIKDAADFYGGSPCFLSNHLKKRRGCDKFKGFTFVLLEDE